MKLFQTITEKKTQRATRSMSVKIELDKMERWDTATASLLEKGVAVASFQSAIASHFDSLLALVEKKNEATPKKTADADTLHALSVSETHPNIRVRDAGGTWLNIEKDELEKRTAAKALGAKFDATSDPVGWYVPEGFDLTPFLEWL